MDTALHERQLARLFAASALFAWAVWTRAALEASPVLHIVVQLPALGFAGWLAGSVAGQKVPALTSAHLNRHGLAGALIALFAICFWMLPRSIDSALATGSMEAAKFVSMPLLVGIPLALSLPRMGLVLRGIVKANTLSMLAVLSWIYQAAPIRICNSYLVDQQRDLGLVLFTAAILLALFWGAGALRGPANRTEDQGKSAAPSAGGGTTDNEFATPHWSSQ